MAWTDRNVGVIEAFRDHLDDKLNERFGYGEILLQIEGMALLKDVFDLSSERGGARHESSPFRNICTILCSSSSRKTIDN